ncbi:DNA translocase FtsK [Providencia sp. JUb39]|uniref:DNA translocase FtsK n=1 Tax=Providencia sp. JUb39 TaxID=2724165 RepID=UPI00164ED955|nr:cell division protein FtsK [Providencia sp. JUb39]
MPSTPQVIQINDQKDPLMPEVREWSAQNQLMETTRSETSKISRIQRHFRIGFNRAARILDMLEAETTT